VKISRKSAGDPERQREQRVRERKRIAVWCRRNELLPEEAAGVVNSAAVRERAGAGR